MRTICKNHHGALRLTVSLSVGVAILFLDPGTALGKRRRQAEVLEKRTDPLVVDISRVPSAPPEPMTRATFTNEGVSKPYSLFTPPRTANGGQRPLLIMLHGCTQDAESFAAATRMNELAIRENVYVLYPEQTPEANPRRCWNWFDKINQTRGDDEASRRSERAWLAALTLKIADEVKADRERIAIAGLSAGGAMASVMASCHPEIFSRVGIHAGVSFAAASDVSEGLAAMKKGSSLTAAQSALKAFECSGKATGKPLTVFVIHGDADATVDDVNAPQAFKHFEALNDLRDDGQANGTFKWMRENVSSKGSARPKKGTLKSTTETYRTGEASAKLIKVKKLGHAWSGGADGGSYSEPKGPSATDLMWETFSGR